MKSVNHRTTSSTTLNNSSNTYNNPSGNSNNITRKWSEPALTNFQRNNSPHLLRPSQKQQQQVQLKAGDGGLVQHTAGSNEPVQYERVLSTAGQGIQRANEKELIYKYRLKCRQRYKMYFISKF